MPYPNSWKFLIDEAISKGCLPLLTSKCVTQRLMTYSVGDSQLAVHDDVPPLNEERFPPNLMKIEDPELLDFLHGVDGRDVLASPYEEDQLQAIADGRLPRHPW